MSKGVSSKRVNVSKGSRIDVNIENRGSVMRATGSVLCELRVVSYWYSKVV